MFMSANNTRLLITIHLCFGVLMSTFGCALLNKADYSPSLKPVRILRIAIDKSQREELFGQFQKFAEEHSFRIEITDFNTNGEHFQVWMLGDGVQIIANDTPGETNEVLLGLYGIYPEDPVDEETIDELLNDLKSYIGEIPNVTISQEK